MNVTRVGRKLVLALFLVAAVLSLRAVTGNRELLELEAQEARLDAALEEKRTFAAELERYRMELARLQAELGEARRRTSPDLSALEEKLAARGVETKLGSASADGQPFTLGGKDLASFSATMNELKESGHPVQAYRVDVEEEGWSADLVARSFVAPPAAPPPPAPAEAWYGIINARVRERIESKQAELDALDQVIGPLKEYRALKEELAARQAMLEAGSDDPLDLLAIARRVFLAEPAAFATGRLERSQARGGLIGRMARPLEDADLVALLPQLQVRIVRRYADTVEVAFQPADRE